MGIENYIYFQRLSFADGLNPSYAYSLTGSSQQHLCRRENNNITVLGGQWIDPIGSAKIWHPILNMEALENPVPCATCKGDSSQAFLWRVFTDSSLAEFRRRQGFGRGLNEGQYMQLLGSSGENSHSRVVYRIEKANLEDTGLLWFSQDPTLALTVGLARAILAEENIHMLGITVCKSDLKSGMNVYRTFSDGNSYILHQLSPDRIKAYAPFSAGEIISHVPKEKIVEGVAYDIDLAFFDFIKRKAEGIAPSMRNLKIMARFLGDLMFTIAESDPDIQSLIGENSCKMFNVLPRTWSMFLNRVPNSIFLQTTI